jgi:hypothetical protein
MLARAADNHDSAIQAMHVTCAPTVRGLVYFGHGGNDAGFEGLLKTALQAPASTTTSWRDVQLQSVVLEVERLLDRMSQMSRKVEDGLVATRETMPTANIIVSLYPLVVKPLGTAICPRSPATLWPSCDFPVATRRVRSSPR